MSITNNQPLTHLSPLSLVLDSNIWLDILVFNDPYTRPLYQALVSKQVIVWIDNHCYAELVCVLEYPQFRRKNIDHNQLLLWVRTHSYFFNEEIKPKAIRVLPICKDKDDQKFIELAYHCQARFLLSKDKALLKLARRMQAELNISVLLPEFFCTNYLHA